MDTKAPFASDSSWSFIDLAPILPPTDGGFWDLGFDGRYIYASPDYDGSIIARFDTTQTFTDLASWTTLDLLTLDTRARYFAGTVFDGRYLYLVPINGGNHVAARFDTYSGCAD